MPSIDEMKQVIEQFLTDAKKSKHYFKDLQKAVGKVYPDAKLREVKKACNALVDEGKVAYFMTGSTTMYVLASRQGETSSDD